MADSTQTNKTTATPEDPTFGDRVITVGREQLGLPYSMGSSGVCATDCGMFTLMTYRKVGIELTTRLADGQAKLCYDNGLFFTNINVAKKGDLVFFKNTYPVDDAWRNITHVGIYEGPESDLVLQATERAGVNEHMHLHNGCWFTIGGFGRIVNNGTLPSNAMENPGGVIK